MTASDFWRIVGGRKQFNGYLYAVLITVMVFVIDGDFPEYAMWLAAALLGTSFAVAMEDRRDGRGFGRRRAADREPRADRDPAPLDWPEP